MVGIRLNVNLSPDLQTLADDLETELAFGMKEAAQAVVDESRRKLIEVNANASGDMSDGIEIVSVFTYGATIDVPKPGKLIEEGRPPGKVPPWREFEPILQRWAKFKGINSDNLYPIAKKIRERGFRARYPFQRALNASENDVRAAIVSRLRVRFGRR